MKGGDELCAGWALMVVPFRQNRAARFCLTTKFMDVLESTKDCAHMKRNRELIRRACTEPLAVCILELELHVLMLGGCTCMRAAF